SGRVGLTILKGSEEEPFSGIEAAPNVVLKKSGGDTTMMDAVLLGTPVPPSVDVGAVVVLFLTPAVVPVTFIETVHETLTVSAPPDKLTVPDPAAAETVPPHELFNEGEAETIRPAGKVSEKEIPLRATELFGLLMVSVSEVEPFSGMLAAPKALAMVGGAVGGAIPTPVSVIVSVLPVMPLLSSVMVTAPVTVFPWSPDTGAKTTLMVQLAP